MLRRSSRRLIRLAIVAVLVLLCLLMVMKAISSKNENSKLENSLKANHIPEKSKVLNSELKDWHDLKQIQEEKARKGPGEQGASFELPPNSQDKKERLYKVNGFNALASDYIALNRSIPDIRNPGCKHEKYLSELPDVSVVIPFHNEHFSVLLRTAYSMINRSPPHLLREIILVDDFSSKPELKQPLDEYLKNNLPKVKVVRADKREGLIRARLLGARVAKGQVIIFIDSHAEANVNWLPPLLDPIQRNRKTVVCPFIDVIDYETFAYRAQDEGARGSFDWELFYKRLPLMPEDLRNPTKPFKSPVMAGGLFAIDASYFWELGGYDEGLEIWGGEQYELSFKIWQCGGELVDAPCSRIGHIYRKFAPFPNPGVGDFVGRNYRRVADVWMDEYTEYILLRRPHYRTLDPGDISKQKALRERLHCKPFKWFMENIAFDQTLKYPPIEPPDYAEGEIRSAAAPLCIDTRFKKETDRFGLEECIKDGSNLGGEQYFILTWHKDIRPRKRGVCWDVSSSTANAPVVLWGCHGQQGNQMFRFDESSQHLIHSITGTCLDCDIERKELFMNQCGEGLKTQKWLFEKVNSTALKRW